MVFPHILEKNIYYAVVMSLKVLVADSVFQIIYVFAIFFFFFSFFFFLFLLLVVVLVLV